MAVFSPITLGLGWAIRRLAQERAELSTQKLEQRLMQANAGAPTGRGAREEPARRCGTRRDAADCAGSQRHGSVGVGFEGRTAIHWSRRSTG
jgi:hypothetical protein